MPLLPLAWHLINLSSIVPTRMVFKGLTSFTHECAVCSMTKFQEGVSDRNSHMAHTDTENWKKNNARKKQTNMNLTMSFVYTFVYVGSMVR